MFKLLYVSIYLLYHDFELLCVCILKGLTLLIPQKLIYLLLHRVESLKYSCY